MIDAHGLEPLALMLGQSDAIANRPESEVIFGRSSGRALLIKALEEAQDRVNLQEPLQPQGACADGVYKLISLLEEEVLTY